MFRLSSMNFFVVLLTIFCIPLLFFPSLRGAWDLPKEIALYLTLSCIFVLSLFEIIKTKKIQQKRTVLDKPFLLLLGLGFLSMLFSKNSTLSFWGMGDRFILHFFALFLCIAWSWIFIQKVQSEKFFRRALLVFFLSGTIACLFFLLSEIPAWSQFWGSDIVNSVGKINSVFGIYAVTLLTLSLGSLIPKRKNDWGFIVPSVLCALTSLLAIFRLDFQVLWGLLSLGMGLLFLIGMAFWGGVRRTLLGGIFVLFIFSLLQILLPNFLHLGRALSPEVNLNPAMSQSIIKDTLLLDTKSFLFGTGPGTFVYNFSLFRPAALNLDPYFWTVRFDAPWNSIYAWVSEFGFLGSIGFLIIVLLICGSVLSAVLHIRSTFWKRVKISMGNITGQVSLEYFSCMIAWLLLTVGMCVSVYNFTLWFIWWTLLAFVVLGLSYIQPSLVKEHEKVFEINPQYIFVFSFFFLILSAATVVGGVLWGKIFVAEKLVFQAESELQNRTGLLQKALVLDPKSSEYSLLFAKHAFTQSLTLSPSDPNLSAKSLSTAIEFAGRAREFDPQNVRVFELLASLYLQTLPYTSEVSLPQSLSYATEAIEKAIHLEPSNPVFYTEKGLIQEFSGQLTEAQKSYETALALKPDYLQASIDLARLFEKQEQFDQAIATYERYQQIELDNPDVLYELGRLYYNLKKPDDEKKAEKLWIRAIQRDPGHSNALYSLGLLYEKRGARALAREYFQKVQVLNPQNKDLEKKLESL